jgi:hypothetical protein
MTLCDACQSLPIRNILRVVRGDISVYDEFQWFQRFQTITGEKTDPFVRWHDSLAGLQNGASRCALCQVILSHLSSSHHYRTNYKDGDMGSLWLEARFNLDWFTLAVYLGDMEPEVRLSGRFSYGTTPGTLV